MNRLQSLAAYIAASFNWSADPDYARLQGSLDALKPHLQHQERAFVRCAWRDNGQD